MIIALQFITTIKTLTLVKKCAHKKRLLKISLNSLSYSIIFYADAVSLPASSACFLSSSIIKSLNTFM